MKPGISTTSSLNRRQWLAATSGAACGTLLALTGAPLRAAQPPAGSWRFCLNTGTIRGQNLSLEQEIDVIAQAGYQGIEPWVEKLLPLAKDSARLKDVRQRLQDKGLTIESAIGFPSWAVDDEIQRVKGFEQARREMDLLAQLGGKRMAAPPAGIPQGQRVELERLAERYHKLLDLGEEIGVLPMLEFWGRNPTCGKLSTAVAAAIESGHPKACILGDVFHAYRGGPDFSGLRLLGPLAMPVLHLNDYPVSPSREEINDSHRVMPGDGVAPLGEIFKTLQQIGARPVLSLELFNREYWKQDALTVAKLGLEKMKAVMAKAG